MTKDLLDEIKERLLRVMNEEDFEIDNEAYIYDVEYLVSRMEMLEAALKFYTEEKKEQL